MFERKRTHPITILINLITALKAQVFLIIVTYVAFGKEKPLLYFSIVAGLILIIIAIIAISWWRFTYEVKEDQIWIGSGIFIRKNTYISKNRIQSIDLTEGILHRIFKLVQVKIETAGTGTESEGVLTAVHLTEGQALREQLKVTKRPSNQVETELTETADQLGTVEEETIVEEQMVTNSRLFIAGITSGGIGVILAFLFFVYSQVEQFVPETIYVSSVEWVVKLGVYAIIMLVLTALCIAWVFSVILVLIRNGKFTIRTDGKDLHISRGLIEKKQLTVPLKRIQGIGFKQSILRQLFGFGTIYAEVAGGSIEDMKESMETVLFPIMKPSEVQPFLERFIPEYAEWDDEIKPVPKRAWRSYIFRATAPLIPALIAMYIYLVDYLWIGLIVTLISAYFGYLRFKDAGFKLNGEQLTLQYRLFSKTKVLLYKRRIQAYVKKQHVLQKKLGVATIRVSIISNLGGSNFKVKQLEEADTDMLADWYSYRKSKNE